MPMLKRLMKCIKKFLSTLLHNILATILVAIIGIQVLISWATGTLNILLQTIKSPVPLWATIALVLLVALYVYTKTSKSHASSKILFYEVNNLKWKVVIDKSGSFTVSETPYCNKHELKLVISSNLIVWNCPKLLECGTKVDDLDIHNLYRKALSHIEKAVRDKTIK